MDNWIITFDKYGQIIIQPKVKTQLKLVYSKDKTYTYFVKE